MRRNIVDEIFRSVGQVWMISLVGIFGTGYVCGRIRPIHHSWNWYLARQVRNQSKQRKLNVEPDGDH